MFNYRKLVDSVVICPYNKSHLIAKSRLQKHIVKCEKNYPEHYKIMCPYNATHRLFKDEITEHVLTCSARNVLESGMHPEPRKHGVTGTVYSEISSTVDCTENWDLEDNNLRSFNNDRCSVTSTGTSEFNINSNSKNNTEKKDLRPPRGFSEAMLREVNEESGVEDLESIVSSLGVGRGKTASRTERFKLIGLGRGKPLNSDFYIY